MSLCMDIQNVGINMSKGKSRLLREMQHKRSCSRR